MIEVGSYPTRSDDAELARMLLWAAGIPHVIADDAGACAFDRTGGVHLLVEERDAEDAMFALTYRPATRKEQP